MNVNEIKLQIANIEARQRKAKFLEADKLSDEKRRLQNRLNNAINAQERQRVYGTRNALIAEAATALREKEISAEEKKRLDFQVGQREAARAAYMSAHGGSDQGFDFAWQEIKTDLAKAAATEAAKAYDPDGAVKAAVVGAVLAKYKRPA